MRKQKRLSETQQMFMNAIDYKALDKALSDPKSRKELEEIFKKVRL